VTSLRLVFAGSPAAAVPSLNALAASGHTIAAVITREDSPQGRRGILTQTPVADAADHLGLTVIKANTLSGDVTDVVAALTPDLGVIVAYGGFVREPLLSLPASGWINLHFSLLPHWRGAAPVQRSIIAGDDITGATVFSLVPQMDAGEILGQLTQSIGVTETAGELLDSLAHSGAELLVRVVDSIADGSARPEPQRGEASFAPKLELADGAIDWAKNAQSVANLIRGVTPEPGAFTVIDDVRVKIVSARIAQSPERLAPGQLSQEGKSILVGTATHPIELITVHPAGRKAMPAGDWWRGRAVTSPAVATMTAGTPE
jgi:methionyl-tRNA formyltransferase